LALPEELAADELASFQLVAGLYDPISMQRLKARTSTGEEVPDGRMFIGPVVMP
jgi:hypothetical protein